MKSFANFAVAVLLMLWITCMGLMPAAARAPQTCPTAPVEGCDDCFTKYACSTGAAPVLVACPPGQACATAGNIATCKPVSQTECGCGNSRIGCDKYNTALKIFCVSLPTGTAVYKGTDCAAGNELCSVGKCVAAPPVTSPESDKFCVGKTTAFYLATPKCTSGVFCDTGIKVYIENCTSGQYFNEITDACETFPPNPCAGCTTTLCPIITACNKYAVCDNGVMVDDETCPDTKYFNPDTQSCSGTAPAAPCAAYKDCVFDIITTTTSISTSTSASTSTSTPTSSSTTLPTSTSSSTTSPTSTSSSNTSPTSTLSSTTSPISTSSSTTSPTSTSTSTTTSTPPPISTTTTSTSTTSTSTTSPTTTTFTPTATTTTPPTTTTTQPATTKPPVCTAADANKRFPHETNCKRYYTCRLISGTTYGYVESACPSTYVFNSATGFCDLPRNVPSCTVTG